MNALKDRKDGQNAYTQTHVEDRQLRYKALAQRTDTVVTRRNDTYKYFKQIINVCMNQQKIRSEGL